MSKVNLEGTHVPLEEVYHRILKFKQGKLLEQSVIHVRVEHPFSPNTQLPPEDLIEQDLNQEISKFIGRIIETKKDIDDRRGVARFEKEALVLDMKEFKYIIDYIITTLTDEQIAEIRKSRTTI
jgi:hypothetical protein